MKDPRKITDQLYVGVQPTADVLNQLSQLGFKSFVNLRDDGDDDQPLSPQAEAKQVRTRRWPSEWDSSAIRRRQ